MPARVDSSSYVDTDRLQIILRDAHSEQCLGTRSLLCYLLYNVLSDNVGDARRPTF